MASQNWERTKKEEVENDCKLLYIYIYNTYQTTTDTVSLLANTQKYNLIHDVIVLKILCKYVHKGNSSIQNWAYMTTSNKNFWFYDDCFSAGMLMLKFVNDKQMIKK